MMKKQMTLLYYNHQYGVHLSWNRTCVRNSCDTSEWPLRGNQATFGMKAANKIILCDNLLPDGNNYRTSFFLVTANVCLFISHPNYNWTWVKKDRKKKETAFSSIRRESVVRV